MQASMAHAGGGIQGHTLVAPPAALRDLVEAVWDIDLPDPATARAMRVRVLPMTAPVLCLHYRAPLRAAAGVAPAASIMGSRRGSGELRASGPVGVVAVRLRPSATARLFGPAMAAFADAQVDLAELIAPGRLAALTETLAALPDAPARIAAVNAFLSARIGDKGGDVAVEAAVQRLRRQPGVTIRSLAAACDVGERQLERRFRKAIGLTPKQYARVARCERVLALRRAGCGWADIAAACGFADQAHMVRDVGAMLGASPEAFSRAVFAAARRPVNEALSVSGFFNTFVT